MTDRERLAALRAVQRKGLLPGPNEFMGGTRVGTLVSDGLIRVTAMGVLFDHYALTPSGLAEIERLEKQEATE